MKFTANNRDVQGSNNNKQIPSMHIKIHKKLVEKSRATYRLGSLAQFFLYLDNFLWLLNLLFIFVMFFSSSRQMLSKKIQCSTKFSRCGDGGAGIRRSGLCKSSPPIFRKRGGTSGSLTQGIQTKIVKYQKIINISLKFYNLTV